MCEHCTRRQFLGAGALGGVALASTALRADTQGTSVQPVPDQVPICVAIAGNPGDRSWSVPAPQMEEITNRLATAQRNLGNVRFVVGQARNAEEMVALMRQAGPDAPVLAISAEIFGPSRGVLPAAFAEGRAVALFHLPVIGGHDWCLIKPWREEGNRVTLFNSTDLADLERAAALLRVIPLLRQSRVLVSPPFKGTPASYTPELVKERLGVEMVAIADGRYDEVLSEVDPQAAQIVAQQWMDEAERIVEPEPEDVLKAACASLALDRLIAENRASALCVGTCMGWLARGFPCLGFSRLNDRGIPAACDGDMDCALTMLIGQHAFHQAGFLGNAAGVDTSRNAFHLSHCSAPLRMEGPDGPVARYRLRDHAEVGGGAVPEVHYRIGQKITFTKLIHLDTLLLFTGTIIDVPEVPAGTRRGCRTELVAEVKDASHLLENWGGGALGASAKDYYASLHRVAYYGDHSQDLRHLAHLLGLKVVQEV